MTELRRVIDVLSSMPAATVYEAAGKCGDMAPSIRPIAKGARLCGPAYTVKVFPCDMLAVLRAIAEAPPASVIVIDAGDTERSTVWGGATTVAARKRGLGGCVTNGAVRDLDEIEDSGFPVFAAGVSVRGTVENHPGWSGITVSVGGVVVEPGDIVLGDSDGVVVVAAARAGAIAEAAKAQRTREIEREIRLHTGEPILDVIEQR